MGRTTVSGREKAYDKQLEEDYVNRAKGRVTRLTPEELKEKIKTFLKNHRICTLATCSQRHTPLNAACATGAGISPSIYLRKGAGRCKTFWITRMFR